MSLGIPPLADQLKVIIIFGGVIGAFFLFSHYYDPISIGTHVAKDGHQFSIGSVVHVCSGGSCDMFEVKYDCEGECAKEEMKHNARDILELTQQTLNRRHFQHLRILTSRAPHERGKVDSDIVFLCQPDGTWTISSEYYK